MGRYKRENIFYNNRWQRTVDLIADAYSCAQRKPSETFEIVAHLMSQAYADRDDELHTEALNLMREAGSPCQFRADENIAEATDDNNRPPTTNIPEIAAELLAVADTEAEEWNKSFDYIFDNRVNVQEVFKALKMLKAQKGRKYNNKIGDKRFYYVAYRILCIINYFSEGTTIAHYLRWVNLHFKHNWPEDKNHLRFQLEGNAKDLADHHPSEWKSLMNFGGLGKIHYQLAIDLKNTFTFVADKDKKNEDSESFLHLKDKPQYLSGAQLVYDRYTVLDEAYINKG